MVKKFGEVVAVEWLCDVTQQKRLKLSMRFDHVTKIKKISTFLLAFPDQVLHSIDIGMIAMLGKIFNKILEQTKTPSDFTKMIVTPVFKKGDKLLRENYRAITLLSIPGKVFLTILLKKMPESIDNRLRETHCGFR